MQTTEQLIARAADPATITAVERVLDHGTSWQKAHGLWVLERSGKLTPATLDKLAADSDRLVRVHAMRIVTEKSEWNEHLRSLALAALNDADAFVQRTAAAALGAHPEAANLPPLLELRRHIPAEDTHLLHQVRMSLRDQLRAPNVWQTAQWSEQDSRALADVCLGVHDVPSAHFLQNHLQHYAEPLSNVLRYGHYIARFGSEGSGSWVLNWAKQKYPTEINLQGQTLRTVLQATQERGAALAKADRDMAQEVTVKLLSSKANQANLGIELAGLFRLPVTEPTLLTIVNDAKANTATRKIAVDALLAIDAKANVPPLGILLGAPTRRSRCANASPTAWPAPIYPRPAPHCCKRCKRARSVARSHRRGTRRFRGRGRATFKGSGRRQGIRAAASSARHQLPPPSSQDRQGG